MSSPTIEGQLSEVERKLLTQAILDAPRKPTVALEVGTWLGGGSTLHILRAMEQNGVGHLWGVEADRSVYDRMIENLRRAAPEVIHRFTPLFGFSQDVLPRWIKEQGPTLTVDLAFLDGGDNPMEQIVELNLLAPWIPVGGQLMAHDARMRKGKWLVPYLARLDNWESEVLDTSEVGLLRAVKRAPEPSADSLRSAHRHLLRQRLNPAEVAAAILPSSVCGLALRLLPNRFVRRLYRG